MRLRITTPLAVVVDTDKIRALRAEDATGGFGIWRGHAPFLTRLTIGVVSWRDLDDVPHYCAVRRGVFSVADDTIAIATREAVADDDLATLADTVLARFRSEAEAEREARVDSTRLQLAAIRRIVSQLQASGRGGSVDFA